MKQFYYLSCMLLLMGCLTMNSCAKKVNDGRVKTGYSRTDELNEVVKKWTKEGWNVHGSTRTLRGAMEAHYNRMAANPQLVERIGTATNCTSTTVCRLAALNSASLDYAMAVANEVMGAWERDASLNESKGEEYNQFHAAFAGKVEARIRGQLEESFALIKSDKDRNQYMIFFLMDQDAAKKSCLSAMEEAVEESKMGMEFGKKVRKYVEEATENGK